MPRCFNLPTIATIYPTLGINAAIGIGLGVGIVNITPQHHRATITVFDCTGVNDGGAVDMCLGSLVNTTSSLPATADEDITATRCTSCIDTYLIKANVVAGQGEITPLATT